MSYLCSRLEWLGVDGSEVVGRSAAPASRTLHPPGKLPFGSRNFRYVSTGKEVSTFCAVAVLYAGGFETTLLRTNGSVPDSWQSPILKVQNGVLFRPLKMCRRRSRSNHPHRLFSSGLPIARKPIPDVRTRWSRSQLSHCVCLILSLG